MTALHQQHRDNAERIIKMVMALYDSSTPREQRSLFSASVTRDATRCTRSEQQNWINRLVESEVKHE